MELSGLASIDGIQDILVLMMKSIELRNEARWTEALECLDEAIVINPELPLCYSDRARVLSELHRYEEALDCFNSLLNYAPSSPEIDALRAEVLGDASIFFEQRLNECPGDLDALLHRGNLYRKTYRYPQALADYDAILKQDASHVDALNNQGSVLFALNRFDAAIDSYSRATECEPTRAEIWYNLGNVCQAQGCLELAQKAYQQAIVLVPDFSEAQMEIGHCWLLDGNYSAGWPHYEWRWQTRQLKNSRLQTPQPLWLGGRKLPVHLTGWRIADDDCLAGKTLLVWAEQGIGDTLQFVRFVHGLPVDGCKIVLRVQSSIRSLVTSLNVPVSVIGDDEPVPFHDFHCPLMSLPLALGIDIPPCFQTYLHADKRFSKHWQELLGPRTRLRVGIAWAGRQYGLRNVTRDLPLSMLAPLADMDVELICLQNELPQADVQVLDNLPTLRCFDDLLNDFSDTAALIDNLDLVISVDTAVAHLAGALGKPCWLMLRYASEWRWQRDREDSPWYPTIRIFRQSKPGDWESVVSKITCLLQTLLTNSSNRSTDRGLLKKYP